ncbi:RNA polymerase II elongation factor [Tieghemostelium lacteum]|uniref:RNA polymerase II elongation factor n=1 Tax=Tieghemostelium lacteum TaxID=361077 RepID=A0A152A4Q5_TIELA|nr:RNA polymerase II elongation factor [Tieghemostelium lacteum]|eukprot:KYR01041.1 RNA polymerase II elongation factor [Tieghemostelium lacteum]
MSEFDEFVKIKEQLDQSVKDNDDDNIIALLKGISTMPVTYEILKKTLIGQSVGKLRNNSNEIIKREATVIVTEWKTVKDVKDTTSPPQTSTTTKTSTTSTTTTSNQSGQKEKEKEKEKVSSGVKSPKSSVGSTSSPTATTTVSSPNPSTKRKADSAITKEKQEQDNKRKETTADASGDEVRTNCIRLFTEAVSVKYEGETNNTPEDIGQQIEYELYQIYNGTTKDYKNKARSIIYNLKNNQQLREHLLSDIISPSKLVSMDSNEMANKEIQEARTKMQKFTLHAAIDNNNNQATTDQFKCGRCKQRKCKYYQMQTRSADEPMTTFVTCTNCNHKWKF